MKTVSQMIKLQMQYPLNYLLKFINKDELARTGTSYSIIIVMNHNNPLISLTQMYLTFFLDDEKDFNVGLVMGTNYVSGNRKTVKFVDIKQVRRFIHSEIESHIAKIMVISGDTYEFPMVLDVYMHLKSSLVDNNNKQVFKDIDAHFNEKFNADFFFLDAIMKMLKIDKVKTKGAPSLRILNKILSKFSTDPKTCDSIFLELSLKHVPMCGHERIATEPFNVPVGEGINKNINGKFAAENTRTVSPGSRNKVSPNAEKKKTMTENTRTVSPGSRNKVSPNAEKKKIIAENKRTVSHGSINKVSPNTRNAEKKKNIAEARRKASAAKKKVSPNTKKMLLDSSKREIETYHNYLKIAKEAERNKI